MTTIYYKDIPEDVVKFILNTQVELKCKKKVGKYSQSQTITHIIKEYMKLMKKD